MCTIISASDKVIEIVSRDIMSWALTICVYDSERRVIWYYSRKRCMIIVAWLISIIDSED